MANQKSKWQETRKARMDELFEGRKFRVVEEVTLNEPVATPLGYKVKSGYRLTLTEGREEGDAADIFVGKALLTQMHEEYDAVEEMPEPRRRGRPRKQPIEQAEEWAGRDMPGDASPVTQPGPAMTNPNADESF